MGTHMTTDELDAIEARANAASAGPWRVDDESWKEVNDITVYCGPADALECLCNMGAPIAAVDSPEEAEISYVNGLFIAHARQDVPALCTEVRKLRDELCQLTSDLGNAERHAERTAGR